MDTGGVISIRVRNPVSTLADMGGVHEMGIPRLFSLREPGLVPEIDIQGARGYSRPGITALAALLELLRDRSKCSRSYI